MACGQGNGSQEKQDNKLQQLLDPYAELRGIARQEDVLVVVRQ